MDTTKKITITNIESDLVEIAVSRANTAAIEEIIDWAHEEHGIHPCSDELCDENPEYFTTLFVVADRADFVGSLVASILTYLPGCPVVIS